MATRVEPVVWNGIDMRPRKVDEAYLIEADAFNLLLQAWEMVSKARSDSNEALLYLQEQLERHLFIHPLFHSVDCVGREAELQGMAYGEYLVTPEWQELRIVALRRAGGRCQGCNTSSRLDVHHRTYERRGCEAISDLTVLCRDCHGRIHGKTE